MLHDDPANDLYYCRTCACFSTKTVHIFSTKTSSGALFKDIIEKFLFFKLSEDSLPHRICLNCANLLSAFNDFAEKSYAAEVELKQFYNANALAHDKNCDDVPVVNEGGSDSDDQPLAFTICNEQKTNCLADNRTKTETNPDTRRQRIGNQRQESAAKSLCVVCLKVVKNLTRHIKKHDTQNNLFVCFCPICGKDKGSVEAVCSHFYSHYNLVPRHEILRDLQCSICSETSSDLQSYLKHTSQHIIKDVTLFTLSSIHCITCGKLILNETLQRHLRHHSVISRFECPHCDRVYAQESGMSRHIKRAHEGIYKYRCPLCTKVFDKNEELRIHQESHEDPRPFQCDACGQTFLSKKHLYYHRQYHHTERGLKVSCDQCSRVFSSSSVLRRHIKTVHLKLKEFQCHVCSVQLSTKQYLKEHLRTHSEERPFVCSKCNKTFQMAGNLRQHMKTHMERTEVCDVCGRRFARRGQLMVHMGCHQDVESPSCHECGRVYLLKADLRKHLRECHPESIDEELFPKNVNGGDGPKVYVCQICSKRFTKRYNFERHLKVHTGETLTCPECGKQYRGRSSLDSHVKTIHTQNKNFTCCICTRAFVSRTNLQNHYRTHTGERPYGCEQCGLTFRTRSGLTGHFKTHVEQPPLQCAVCGARFRLRCSLVEHLSRHADKRYPCPSCVKHFATKQDLWKHRQIHRTDRTYGCPYCEATFNVRRYLAVHLKTHASKDGKT